MTDSQYKIDANQWPQVLEDNWSRLRGQFADGQDSGRWIMQIEGLLLSPVTAKQIMDGIQWALIHLTPDSFFTPGPKDIVSWIRRSRHNDKERPHQSDGEIKAFLKRGTIDDSGLPQEIFENGKRYFRLTVEEEAEIRKDMRECCVDMCAPKHAIESKEQGYELLEAGTTLRASDEYWNGTEWLGYGEACCDSDGRSLRFVKYADGYARRKV